MGTEEARKEGGGKIEIKGERRIVIEEGRMEIEEHRYIGGRIKEKRELPPEGACVHGKRSRVHLLQ